MGLEEKPLKLNSKHKNGRLLNEETRHASLYFSNSSKSNEYKMACLSEPKEDPPLSPREALYLILWCSVTSNPAAWKEVAGFYRVQRATAPFCSVTDRFCVEKGRSELESRMSAPKTAELKTRYEIRNRSFAAKTTDLKPRDELRTDIFASKMADLNLSSEFLNLVNSHFCVENGRSELQSGAPKSREIAFLRRK